MNRLISGELVDGDHQGLWSGYEIRIGEDVVIETDFGCRGIDFPVTVRVTDGQIEVLP